MPIERCIVNNNMDVSGQIEVYIPDPDFATAVEEWVVVTHNKPRLAYDSRYEIPAHVASNISSGSSCCF